MPKYSVVFSDREDPVDMPLNEVSVEADNADDAIKTAWPLSGLERSVEIKVEAFPA